MASFKVDENLPLEATLLFQDAGLDALSVHDQGMVGTSDANIATVCQAERRAIITLDLDFADIRAYPPAEHFGLIVLRLNRQDKIHVLEVLGNLLARFNSDELAGKLWIVSEKSIRIHD